MKGARIHIAACLLSGALGCAPAARQDSPAPPATPAPASPTLASPPARAATPPALPVDPEARLAAWIFDLGEARRDFDPARLAMSWARDQALARALEERFDGPAPRAPAPAWWGEDDLRHAEVERWKQAFRTRWEQSLRVWTESAAPYAPHVRAILREEGLPPELWVLTLLESGFRPGARSSAAAVGPWQFLAGTARHTGLILNADRDQRLDWELATRAACRYLLELRDDLGEGLLALAAFNCGPGRVRKATTIRGEPDFWAMDLPAETEKYVARALALVDLIGNGDRAPYAVDPSAALAYDTVDLPEPVRIHDLAAVTGTTTEEIRHLNPSWLLPVTPGDGHPVLARVPAGSKTAVELALSDGVLRAMHLHPDRVHRVSPGDTLWGISRRYRVALSELREVNGLTGKTVIRPGQTLRIPGGT